MAHIYYSLPVIFLPEQLVRTHGFSFLPMAKFVTTVAGRMIRNLITAVAGVVRTENQLYTPLLTVKTTEIISEVLLLLSLKGRV